MFVVLEIALIPTHASKLIKTFVHGSNFFHDTSFLLNSLCETCQPCFVHKMFIKRDFMCHSGRNGSIWQL